MIARADITGLVLAGGRGSRMGGVDKGLQSYQGMPLAMHAMLRLAPQVGAMIINANRNLAAYESFGVPVFPDASGDFAGPLAGFVVGLEQCETPYLATVPCDSPLFPVDLVDRMAAALADANAEIAVACAPEGGVMRAQPVFCLMNSALLESLVRFTHTGGRKIDRWTAQHACVEVPFDDVRAFFNANTLAELHDLQQSIDPDTHD
ncbi:MAG: molybdenum cofactor guanylyltransferase MobA [Burkholderiales bacterium]